MSEPFDVRDGEQLAALEALAKTVRPGLRWAQSVHKVLPALLARVKELEGVMVTANNKLQAAYGKINRFEQERDAFARRVARAAINTYTVGIKVPKKTIDEILAAVRAEEAGQREGKEGEQ